MIVLAGTEDSGCQGQGLFDITVLVLFQEYQN